MITWICIALSLPSGPPPGAHVLLADGRRFDCATLQIAGGTLRAEGGERLPLAGIREIAFPVEAAFDARRPHAIFAAGGRLAGAPIEADTRTVCVRVPDVGDVRIPLRDLRALRMAFRGGDDPRFLRAVAEPPARDTLFVERRAELIAVSGLFRGIKGGALRIAFGGRERSIELGRVYGIVFAPAAGERPPPPEVEAEIVLARAGSIRGTLDRLDAETLRLGTPAGPVAIPRAQVAAIRLRSGRVTFVSDLEPIEAHDIPFFDRPYGHRRDRSTCGGPIRLGGRTYAKGIGMHALAMLRYRLDGAFSAFSAFIGIDDAARGGCATFRVKGDGRLLLEKVARSGDPPAPISVPVAGVRVLALEVGFGPDGVDIGDHADWADARLVKGGSR